MSPEKLITSLAFKKHQYLFTLTTIATLTIFLIVSNRLITEYKTYLIIIITLIFAALVVYIISLHKKLESQQRQLDFFRIEKNKAVSVAKTNAIKFESVIEQAIDAVIIIDDSGMIYHYNPAAIDIFGYPANEVIGENVIKLLPDRYNNKGKNFVKQYLDKVASNSIGFTHNFDGRRCDGTVFPVELSIKEMYLKTDRYFTCVVRDITDRLTSNQLISHYTTELKRSNQALQQFAYVASHDLQEPLRVIASYAELLNRRYQGQLDEKADKFLTYIVEGTGRLQEMIRGILAYARVDTQGKKLKPVSLEKVVQWALQNLDHTIIQNQVTITHDILPEVLGDDTQLGQVFQNLIGNAIKYRKPSVAPSIHIEVEARGKDVQIAVKDNGIGIEEKFLDRVFEIFQRVHDRSFVKGNGIGLTITKKIIERHGGKMWVDSKLNEGSTFYLTLKAKGSPG